MGHAMSSIALNTRQEVERLKAELEELRRENERLAGLAYRDALTGLRNRRLFTERLCEEVSRLQRGRKAGLSVVCVDVNDFKQVNDARGHAAGDAALVAVGQYLESLTRSCDVVCRVGGDEFAILLPDSDATQSQRIVNRIRESLSTLETAGLGSEPLAMGMATFQEGDDERCLLARADDEMYADKRRAHGSQSGVYASAA